MAHPGDIHQYVAGTDFDFPNLRVKAGQPLPDRWQHRELVRRLKDKYGEDCVVQRVVNFRRESGLPVEEASPEPEEESPDVVGTSRVRKGRKTKNR